jgi:hypothetical protein
LNAAKCKLIFLIAIRNSLDLTTTLIRDLGVIFDTRMSFLSHVETIIPKSARMLGFIKRIFREFNDHYTDKAQVVSLVRPNLEYVASVWSPHQVCHSEKVDRVQHNFVMLFAGFTGRSIHWQHMTLGVPCWVLSLLRTGER